MAGALQPTRKEPTLSLTDSDILDLLAEGLPPCDVAMEGTDRDVAAGEYEGCSSELEQAASEYEARAERLLAQVTP